jgi:signal transduction histidine kinase
MNAVGWDMSCMTDWGSISQASRFKAKALEKDLAAHKLRHAREAKELAGLVSNAISQTRSLARGLDPVEVETIGLPAALQNLAAEANRFFNIICRFRCSEVLGKVDGQTALGLYRIVQEAIHNAITHGEATEIDIELSSNSDHGYLRVTDNGKGFTIEDQVQTGMGLRVMQYRAQSVGGSLSIQSEPGRGTTIYCRLPAKALVLPAVAPRGFKSVNQTDTSPA